MTTPPRTAADRHPLEQHLGEIWNALSFDAKLALMNRGRGLDPIIAALRQAAAQARELAALRKRQDDEPCGCEIYQTCKKCRRTP